MIIPNDLIIYQNVTFAFTVKVLKHGTIIRTEATWKKIPSWKSIEFSVASN